MEAAARDVLMMLLAGGPDLQDGVGLEARVMGESDSVEELAIGNIEGEIREGTVGRVNWDQRMGVGVGQMEVSRIAAV